MRGMKMEKSFLKVLLLSAVSVIAFAQTDDFEVFDSEEIDVDGVFREKPRPSAADRMREQRARLEKKNEELVRKKIEDARIREEQRMTRRLQNMFNGKGFVDDVQDSVSTGAAAPQKVTAEAPSLPGTKTASVSVGAGLTTYQVAREGNIAENDYSSDASFNIAVDGKVADRFMMGVGFNYVGINFEDNPFNGFYNTTFQQPREIEGRIMAFDVHGKFIFTRDSRVKPFVGLQAAYNRMSLEFSNQNPTTNGFGNFYNNYGQEEYTKGFMSAGASAGLIFDINESFGINAQVGYNKGFGSSSDSDSRNNNIFFNPNIVDDRVTLESVGSQIQSADAFTLNIGVQANF